MEINKIYQGDCIEIMPLIDDKSIDMILCDLPYGTITCKWDTTIPFEPLWEQYKRIIKDNRAIVLTASQPFTTDLINSNRDWFKYCWVWNKFIQGNFLLAKYQPLKIHEDIIVFSKNVHKYIPQMTIGKLRQKGNYESKLWNIKLIKKRNDIYYPKSIIEFSNSVRGKHQTQKPVALFEYLIRTYTNEGDLVLDNCIGSGTTAVACLNTKRNFIGMDIEQKYVDMSNERIKDFSKQEVLINV